MFKWLARTYATQIHTLINAWTQICVCVCRITTVVVHCCCCLYEFHLSNSTKQSQMLLRICPKRRGKEIDDLII